MVPAGNFLLSFGILVAGTSDTKVLRVIPAYGIEMHLTFNLLQASTCECSNKYLADNMPFILLCLTPDDFTCQW